MLLTRMRPRKPYHHGHLEETLLKTAIQLIGEVGATGLATGAHLHLEIQVDGRAVDPLRWLASP